MRTDAKIAGIKLIAEATDDLTEAAGLSYKLDVNDILTNSWGPIDDGQRLEGESHVCGFVFS